MNLESEEEILNLEGALESVLQIISQELWRHTRVLEPRKGNGGERAAAEMGKESKNRTGGSWRHRLFIDV